MRAVSALVVLVAGCGDNEHEPDDGARSGTRLRLTWFDVDGTRQWQPELGAPDSDVKSELYVDRERGEACAPELWQDDVLRCTPQVVEATRTLYADAECTMRVSEDPQLHKYAGDYDERCGESRVAHVYPIVQTIATSAVYSVAADGTCALDSTTATELGVLGDELSRDSLATMTSELSPEGDRVQIWYRQSADGLHLPIGLYDWLLGAGQLVHTRMGDQLIPSTPVSIDPATWFFSDDACTRAYVRVEAGCPAPHSASDFRPPWYAIGPSAASPPGYTQPFGACQPLAELPDGDFFEVLTKNPIDPVEMTIRAAHDKHRVVLQHASAGSVAFRLRELFDTLLMTECTPRKFPDDVYRCAPPDAAELVSGFYTDAGCHVPLDVAHVRQGYRTPRLVLSDRTLRSSTLEIRELDEHYIGPLFAFGNTQCLAVDTAGALYRVGRRVEWSELATATLVTD